MADMYLD